MRKVILLLIILAFQYNLNAQIQPSIYSGIGLGTNLGGLAGIGTEIKYKAVSFNFAVGSWLNELPEHTGAQSRLDYDFGIKFYSKLGIFAGINYGIIGEALYTKKGQDIMHFAKTRGFSFTLGYRRNMYKNLYGLVYFGVTSNERENQICIFGNCSFLPRMGVLIGYEFINK